MTATVHIVDDDAALRDATALFLKLNRLPTRVYGSAEEFLASSQGVDEGVLLLDLKLGGMSGLDLQAEVARRNLAVPVVMVTAHADVATTRAALKAGAFDFLDKPVDNALLLDVVWDALAHDQLRRESAEKANRRRQRLKGLTAREREVFALIVVGRTHREIGAKLGISPRTVEVYKSRMMVKLQARTLADLIRLATEAGIGASSARELPTRAWTRL